MPRNFEFIDGRPSSTNAAETRRRIRSQAARAGNDGNETATYRGLSQRTRGRRAIFSSVTTEVPRIEGAVGARSYLEQWDANPTNTWYSTNRPTGPVILDRQALIPFAGNDTALPFSQSRLYSLPFLSLVLDNYLTRLTAPVPELDGPTESDLLKKIWFPMVLHSKSLFQIIVLLSASNYALHQQSEAYARDVLFIKQHALQDLREVLSTDGGLGQDETIAAVGKMASYEAIFGSKKDFDVHIYALQRMLNHRGGLSTLGMNGFLARLLIFIDTNSSILLNVEPHLIESVSPRRPANLNHFQGCWTR